MKRILILAAALFTVCTAFAQSEYNLQRRSLFEVLPVYSSDIVFLGNSITDGCEWAELFNNRHVKNRGISGDRSGWLLDRLDPIVGGHPKKLFLMIGVNDLAAGVSPDEIVANVARLIDRFQSESRWTKIYVQSILPVNGESFAKFKNHYEHGRQIVPLNKRLEALCDEKEVTYLDVWGALADHEGRLDKRYTNDGLHLTGEGYVVWRDAIKQHVTLSNPIFRRISRLADEQGVQAFVVGGYVRDHYLRRPSTDIDVVVVGSGIALAEALARELKAKVSVFKTFGTAMVRARNVEVEFVGARRESYTRDSRKPEVEPGTLADDQRRRDFTINAMAWSLNGATFGELVDPFDGMSDLEECIIRTPCDPDVTFSDDPLRMMRAVRFASQLGFTIEEETFEAIRRNAERIRIVSRERIVTELNKIVLSPVPSMGFELLELTGLLERIFPEMHNLKGVEKRGRHAHKDNFIHTLKVVDNVARRSGDLWLRWAAVLHDIAKPLTKAYDPRVGWTFHGHEVLGSKMVPAIFRQLKLPLNEHMKFVQKLVFLHLRPIILSEDLVTDSAVRRLLFEAGDDVEALMTLCEADITSGIDAKVKRYLSNFELVRRKMKDLEERDRIRNFQPPITGELIMETYGIGPGRVIGDMKEIIKNAILDGEIPNEYDAAYALMERLAAERGLTRVRK